MAWSTKRVRGVGAILFLVAFSGLNACTTTECNCRIWYERIESIGDCDSWVTDRLDTWVSQANYFKAENCGYSPEALTETIDADGCQATLAFTYKTTAYQQADAMAQLTVANCDHACTAQVTAHAMPTSADECDDD